MKSLSLNWFTENPIDEEHKRYVLLDYLQDIDLRFDNDEIYPQIIDVSNHIDNLEMWDKRGEFYIGKGELRGIDFEQMTLIYDIPDDDPNLIEINKIVKYSIPKFRQVFKRGRNIWRKVEENLKWDIIGIVPQYKNEGYVFINILKTVKVYKYTISSIIDNIEFDLIKEEEYGLGIYEHLKMDLIKNGNLPFPLTISVESPKFPVNETILPVVKKLSLIKIKSI